MKVALTCGVFDLLHQGHLELLELMREQSDLTVVVLHDGFTTFKNKKKFPIENLEKRTRNLIETGLVDIVRYTFSEEPHQEFEAIIKRFEDVVFYRGDDWLKFPAHETIEEMGIEIIYKPYLDSISSSLLRNQL